MLKCLNVKMLKCLNDKRGFTLIEVTVAMFLVTVGVLGVFTVIQRTISFISISSSKLVASYLAQEGIETIRNIRDSNWLEDVAWDNGLTICSSGCEADYKTNTLQEETPLRPYGAGVYLNIDSDGFYSYSSGTITSLKRKIIIHIKKYR